MEGVDGPTGDIRVVQAAPRLDLASAPALGEGVERALDGGARCVVLDLSSVTYLSSAGLSALLRAAKLANSHGARIVLAGARQAVSTVLDLSRFTMLFDLFGSTDEAVRALGAQPRARVARGPAPAQGLPELTLAEEVLLLALEDESGRLVELPEHSLEYALASAVLMDLCLRGRLDGDLRSLTVLDTAPLGDDILDPALAELGHRADARDAQSWIRTLAADAAGIRTRALDRLVARGILRRDRSLLHWAVGRRRYPVADNHERLEVRTRLLRLLRGGDIPDPRDVLIVALADACAVFDAIIEMDELVELRQRITDIAHMDLLAISMARALVEVRIAERGESITGDRIYGTVPPDATDAAG